MPQGKSAEFCEKIQQTNWNHFLVNILSNVLVFTIKHKYISSQTQVHLKQNTSAFQSKCLSVLIKTYLPFLRRHRRPNKHLVYNNLHKQPQSSTNKKPRKTLCKSPGLFLCINLSLFCFVQVDAFVAQCHGHQTNIVRILLVVQRLLHQFQVTVNSFTNLVLVICL